MIEEIVWTSGASADFQAVYAYLEEAWAGSGDALIYSTDRLLGILRSFPEQGTPVSLNARRLLIGRHRHHGLFYCVSPRKLHMVAVIDLRRDPEAVAAILRERGVP
jgi:hypothetical protein